MAKFSAEDHLQIQVYKYCSLQYPNLLFNHIPNEGKRGLFAQKKLKNFGVTAGMPDVMIYDPMGGFNGLAIELKAIYHDGRKNYCTNQQKWCLEMLKQRGWSTHVCWSVDDAKKIIDLYVSEELH